MPKYYIIAVIIISLGNVKCKTYFYFQLVESMFSNQTIPSKTSDTLLNSNNSKLRLQDRQLQEMSDTGMCLSMHQVRYQILKSYVPLDKVYQEFYKIMEIDCYFIPSSRMHPI